MLAVLAFALAVYPLLVRVGRFERSGKEADQYGRYAGEPSRSGLELVRGRGVERPGGHLGQLKLAVLARVVVGGFGHASDGVTTVAGPASAWPCSGPVGVLLPA